MNDIKFIAIFLTSSCMMALVLIMVIQVGMGESFLPDDCTLSGKNRNAPRIETCPEYEPAPDAVSGSPMIYAVGKPTMCETEEESEPDSVLAPPAVDDDDWSQFDLDIDEPADNGPTEDEKRKLMETLDGMELSENWDFSKRRIR